MKNFLLILILLSTSCISNINKHGYMFDLIDENYVQEGVTTKERIKRELGSPTYVSYIDREEVWLYFYEKTDRILFFKPKILERKILLVNFHGTNTAKEVRKFDLLDEDEHFKFSQEMTKVQSKEDGFFTGLFGNVGQVSAQ